MNQNEKLRRLATSLVPTAAEIATAEKHFQTITTRLGQSFGASRFILIGSHVRDTAIRSFSDIDLLAVLPRSAARWGGSIVSPRTFLSKVSADLQMRFTNTSVRADGQAVVLRFARGAHSVDVVPGIYEEMKGKRPMYLIPGTRDEWISTSPETHDVIFNEANRRSGGKLGGLGRLIKAWKYGRRNPIPLLSLYTDMVLATTDLAAGPKTYAQCLRDFFAKLVERDVRGLRDPGGVAGIIRASDYQGHLDNLYAAAQFAREHADSALYADKVGKHSEAIRQWEIVFNRTL